VAPAPAALDYGNRTVVNFQRVPGYPFEINTGIRAAVYHISDTPKLQCLIYLEIQLEYEQMVLSCTCNVQDDHYPNDVTMNDLLVLRKFGRYQQ